MDEFDLIITDSDADAAIVKMLEEKGVEVVLV
jgi:DeoR/GlpR family transcriptional regulator of sugar metabolism